MADTDRDRWGKDARREMFTDHKEDSIAPILPIEMGLTVYGNEFLSIGDFVTINFLPKQYKDRSFFQIVGIEHKITPEGWDTTYNLIFRIMPKEKKNVIGEPKYLDGDGTTRINMTENYVERKTDKGTKGGSTHAAHREKLKQSQVPTFEWTPPRPTGISKDKVKTYDV